MHAKRAKFWGLVLFASIAFCFIHKAVAEEKSILEGANVVGTDLMTIFYDTNCLISDAFASFVNIEAGAETSYVVELAESYTINTVYVSNW